MKLRRIAIRRLAGIASPGFELDGFSDGINIVHGPNASGKSSVARALRALLDARASPGDEAVDLEAEFEDPDGMRWQAVRIGRSLMWTCDGEPGQAPPLPDPRCLAGYTLHVEDLLESGDRHDARIAREIARDLAGGYDFAAARDSCKVAIGPRFGHGEAKALGEAESELRGIEERQRSLAREEAHLETLEGDLVRLEAQVERLPRVLRAKEWLGHRKRSRDLEAMLLDFPSGMDRLRGDEIERLGELERAHDRVKSRYEAAGAEVQAFERKFRQIGLSAESPDHAILARARARLRLLSERENALQQARQSECEALAERDAAGCEIGTPSGVRARIDPATLGEVERGLAAYRGIEADLRAIEKERDGRAEHRAQSAPKSEGAGEAQEASTIEGVSVDSDPDIKERLQRALRALVQWTAATKHPAGTFRRVGFALSLLICIGALLSLSALFGAGFGVGSQAPWLPALAFFLIGALAGVCGLLVLDLDPQRARRERARASFAEQGVAGPKRWTGESVRDRIESLIDELAFVGERIANDRRIEYLDERLREREDALIRERKRLEATARKVHFDPLRLDASFERWLRLVDRYARADGECIKSRSRCEDLSAQADILRREIDSFLAGYEASSARWSAPKAADPSAPDSAEIFQSRLEILQTRVRARDDALRAKDEAERRFDEGAAADERCRAEIDSIYRQAGLEPGNEAELRRRLGRLGQWRSHQEVRSEVVGAEKSCTFELRCDTELTALAKADDDRALDRLIDTLEGDKERISSLQKEITRIRTLVDQAGQGGALERARAKCRRRSDALERRFEDAKRAEARAFWFDEIEAAHRTDSRPAVLRRAESWFAHFSRHQFALEVSSRDRFSARDTANGARRALSELSTATRMQLRLAVRIAWALEAEKGRASLPFFLDEALTTADPERFRIVARSLADLASEGRQIFYLTAQPFQACHWQASEASVIDLAARRGLERAVGSASDIALPPAPSPPPLIGDDAPEEYAQRLGVPAIDPWQPDSTHPFYLLRDDLPLLRRLLVAGIHHLGALDSLLASGDAAVVLDPLDLLGLRRLSVAARVWFEAWQEGRGRPVDAGALERSGIVSEVFIDRVLDIVRKTEGDARRLLDAMGSLRNFRKDRLEEMRQWLFEQGHLTDMPPIDESALEGRVARALLDQTLDESAETTGRRQDALLGARSLARSLQAGLIDVP